jgi:hypothetical protein
MMRTRKRSIGEALPRLKNQKTPDSSQTGFRFPIKALKPSVELTLTPAMAIISLA